MKDKLLSDKSLADKKTETGQPYQYQKKEIQEPDWRRIFGYRNVTLEQWRDAKWQQKNTVTSVDELRTVFGHYLPEDLANSIAFDQKSFATMSLRITPQMLNTMNENDLWSDPIRRYMLPAVFDRDQVWHTHPKSQRDSLHEAEMSMVEGLIHRYPTKVLVELIETCPVYCGHCTRMDVVGPNVPTVIKNKMRRKQQERLDGIISYLKTTTSVRDVVISGGDIANVRPTVLEDFVTQVLRCENIRTIRLATKALISLPQHFLAGEILEVMARIAQKANAAGVSIAIHTHTNHAQSITPLVAEAAKNLFQAGFRNIRNQGVLLNRVNASSQAILDLCFALSDHCQITPYYFYLCDLIPHSEHWRISINQAKKIKDEITGYLSGFETPRFVVDVPYVGKRDVHQHIDYNEVLGISYWEKNYSTPIETGVKNGGGKRYPFFDPVVSLPFEGQAYWKKQLQKYQEKQISLALKYSIINAEQK